MLSSGLIIHAEYLGIEVMNLPGDLKNPPVGRKNKGETQRVAGEFICFWGVGTTLPDPESYIFSFLILAFSYLKAVNGWSLGHKKSWYFFR